MAAAAASVAAASATVAGSVLSLPGAIKLKAMPFILTTQATGEIDSTA